MSGGKRKGTAAPPVLPVPRVRVLPEDAGPSPPVSRPTADAAPPRRAPLARKRRSRFVF
ncbi:MAG: hypothetical protein U1F48_10915 [Burkholderiales bacterium]